MPLSDTQIGILRSVAANQVNLDEIGEWMRDQLIELIMHDPMLIDSTGPSVFLTKAGGEALRHAAESCATRREA